MSIDRNGFYEWIRPVLFKKRITDSQVQGCEHLLDCWESHWADRDIRWLAYALATTYHETAMTMQPIDERGGTAYFTRLYDVTGSNPARARSHGNTVPGDGPRYRGRGFVQLTWKVNYAAMERHLTQRFGRPVPLVAQPELAKDPAFAAEILFHGMEQGSFTGRRLSQYFSRRADGSVSREDWVGARRIVNGRDKAFEIAAYGIEFYAALSSS